MSDFDPVCRLCLQPAKLVKSHVIPEFIYKPMYDEKNHRYFVISTDPAIPERTRPKGIYERLLCAKCDGEIGCFEDYAAKVLNGGTSVGFAQVGNELRMKGLDYAKLRLFHMSMLWRMAVSSHEFFKLVQLGSHQERLRRLILAGSPGEPSDYAMLAVAPLFDAEFLGDWIMPPDSVRVLNRRVYRCLIGGIVYNYFVGAAPLPKPVLERALTKEGTWVIIRQKIEQIPFLTDLALRMGKAMHERDAGGNNFAGTITK